MVNRGLFKYRNLYIPYRIKLISSFFLIIISMALVIGVTYYQKMSGELRASTLQNLDLTVEKAVTKLDMNMESVQKAAWEYFSDTDVQLFVEQLGTDGIYVRRTYYTDKLGVTLRGNSFISSIALYSLSGKVFSNGILEYEDRTKLLSVAKGEKERMMDKALNNNGSGEWIVMKMQQERTGELAYTLSYIQAIKQISATTQYPVGFIRIDLDRHYLSSLLQELKLQEADGSYYIADKSGRIVFAEESAMIGKSLLGQSIMQVFEQGGGQAHLGSSYVDGGKHMNTYRTLGFSDWMVVGLVPSTKVLQNANEIMNYTLLIVGIALLIGMTLAILIAAGVTKPLRQFLRSMREVERGNFHIQIQPLSNDEVGALSIGFNRMTRQIRDLINQVYHAELASKEAEIQALQFQINPHFLYNALGTIDGLVSAKDDKRIGSISRSLSEMFRYSISGTRYATLQEELQQIKQYLTIQQIRFSDKFTYQISVEPHLLHVEIPKLLLQPIVENAYIHGCDLLPTGGRIHIRALLHNDDTVMIIVEDNGPGMDEALKERIQNQLDTASVEEQSKPTGRLIRGNSVGMLNVSRRIRLLYGEHYGVSIWSERGMGTKVYLSIPYQLKEGD